MKKKIAIVGYTPSRVQAPYDDPEWEIWGLNTLYEFDDVPRYDRWFEIHSYGWSPSRDKKIKKVREAFKSGNTPLYMQEVDPDIPNSRRYPVEKAREMFGDYFTNSVSYMIALAIMEGAEEIGIYGIDMATDSEFGYQKPSCEYFIGIARGRGIKVHIPHESDLLKTRFQYGYETPRDLSYQRKIEQARKQAEANKKGADAQLKNAQEVLLKYEGAIEAFKYVEKTWGLVNSEKVQELRMEDIQQPQVEETHEGV